MRRRGRIDSDHVSGLEASASPCCRALVALDGGPPGRADMARTRRSLGRQLCAAGEGADLERSTEDWPFHGGIRTTAEAMADQQMNRLYQRAVVIRRKLALEAASPRMRAWRAGRRRPPRPCPQASCRRSLSWSAIIAQPMWVEQPNRSGQTPASRFLWVIRHPSVPVPRSDPAR